MSLNDGAIFAGFRIVRLLGSKGMGDVYLVQHPRLPRRDALKVLPADVSADAEYRSRFNREADLASTLWHPHIVGVHDRGESEGHLWISMDFVDGQDAARLLADRYPAGMPVEQVVRIVTAVASAVDYAHKQALLHRDVKPANIMVTHLDDDGELRILLADFGIARDIEDISGLTTTNMTVGTVAYAPPEQLMGEEIDGRADQYALAATAYHLLTGSQLFPHSNPAVVISQHLNAAPPVLADTRPEFAALDPVLAVALAKDPKDRFPRCTDFARALADQNRSLSSGVSAVAPTLSAPVQQRPTPNTATSSPAEPISTAPSRPWLIPAVAGAVLVVGIGAVFAWHAWSRDTPSTDVATSTASAPPPVASPSTSTTPPPPPPPRAVAASAIDTLLLDGVAVNQFAGSSVLEVADSSYGMSDNVRIVTPAACVGVIYGGEHRVYADTGFVAMRDETFNPRPYSQTSASGPWVAQQTAVVFPSSEEARTALATSKDQWQSCTADRVMQKGYEDSTPWQLSSVQLQGDVLTVSLADVGVVGPVGGACQHALGVKANVVAEARICVYEFTAGDSAERMVNSILDRVQV